MISFIKSEFNMSESTFGPVFQIERTFFDLYPDRINYPRPRERQLSRLSRNGARIVAWFAFLMTHNFVNRHESLHRVQDRPRWTVIISKTYVLTASWVDYVLVSPF